MKATKWGIIGPGNIAHHFARDLEYAGTPQQIQAVLGKDKESIKNFAEEFNVPQVFTDPDEFMAEATIDAAYVATPHALHYEEVLSCLRHNIPVLCEKPMTINTEQCNELIATARHHKTFLMEGMWLRFLPSIQHLLNIIEDDQIGRIVSIKASMCYKAPHDAGNRFFNPELGGGSLLDLGIYPVFLALLLLGKPDTIKAIGTLSDEGVDEDCSMLFHYKTGQHATLESSLVSGENTPAEIAGEKGTITILNPWFEKSGGIEVHRYDEGRIIYPCQWPGHGLQFETEEVLNCIRNNKISSDILPHSFSRDMITVMDEILSQVKVTYDMYE
jgi:predicted dehydrogenase